MSLNDNIKDAELLKAEEFKFEYRQKCTPASSNLDLLTYGTYRILPNAASDQLYHHTEEVLLFMIKGQASVHVDKQVFQLKHYDTLYIPLQTLYSIYNENSEEALLIVCKATADRKHEPFYASWEKFSKDEERIRHLKGKDVFLMFDVSENADKLIAGYTVYEPQTRAWPAHNHTDQEEIYIFIQGSGAMEVYADDENKTFVTSLDEMDAVSIPILNYHPVFSQEKPLTFIWCIAGKRYWVGDKNKDFMKGDTDKLTT